MSVVSTLSSFAKRNLPVFHGSAALIRFAAIRFANRRLGGPATFDERHPITSIIRRVRRAFGNIEFHFQCVRMFEIINS